jgi:hypothetical protein
MQIFPPAGWRCWGWVYKNQYQNEYQMNMEHFPFSPNLYTTRHVLRNNLRDLRAWRTFKLAFPSTGWRCWAGNGSTKTDIKMNIKWLRLKRYSLFTNWHFESFDSFLRWMNKSSILNCLKDSRLLWKYSSTTLSKFQTNDQSILMMCTQLSLFRNVLCWTPTKKRFHLAVKPNTYNLQTEITIREQLDF